MADRINELIVAAKKYDIESLALEAGLKPAIRAICSNRELIRLAGVWRKKRAYIERSAYKVISSRQGLSKVPLASREGNIIVYISHNKNIVKELSRSEAQLITGDIKPDSKLFFVLTQKIGELLGYPGCCINFFSKFNSLSSQDIKMKAISNTAHSFSFYLNNFYEHSGARLHSLVSHLPCSYDCKYSLIYAKKILDAIRGLNFKDALKIENLLRLPLIYFPGGRVIVLDSSMAHKKKADLNAYYFGDERVILKDGCPVSVEHKIHNTNIRVLDGASLINRGRGRAPGKKEAVFLHFC